MDLSNPINAVHVFDYQRGSRNHATFSEGLWAHPAVNVSFSSPYVAWGRTIAGIASDLEQKLLRADVIFRAHCEPILEPADNFIELHQLWHKVIYYDFRDTSDINEDRRQQCLAYAKRSWPVGPKRLPRQDVPDNVFPTDYAVLDVFCPDEKSNLERDIDVVYMFADTPKIGQRRYTVMQALQARTTELGNTVIGSVTVDARKGRQALFLAESDNPLSSYLGILRRAKIVFTAFPTPHDGDSRTWEAMSSGAMVFLDTTHIPHSHPMQHGEHCYRYDASNPASIERAITAAHGYLKDNASRERIAAAGTEFARKQHSALSRVDELLKLTGFL